MNAVEFVVTHILADIVVVKTMVVEHNIIAATTIMMKKHMENKYLNAVIVIVVHVITDAESNVAHGAVMLIVITDAEKISFIRNGGNII